MVYFPIWVHRIPGYLKYPCSFLDFIRPKNIDEYLHDEMCDISFIDE